MDEPSVFATSGWHLRNGNAQGDGTRGKLPALFVHAVPTWVMQVVRPCMDLCGASMQPSAHAGTFPGHTVDECTKMLWC